MNKGWNLPATRLLFYIVICNLCHTRELHAFTSTTSPCFSDSVYGQSRQIDPHFWQPRQRSDCIKCPKTEYNYQGDVTPCLNDENTQKCWCNFNNANCACCQNTEQSASTPVCFTDASESNTNIFSDKQENTEKITKEVETDTLNGRNSELPTFGVNRPLISYATQETCKNHDLKCTVGCDSIDSKLICCENAKDDTRITETKVEDKKKPIAACIAGYDQEIYQLMEDMKDQKPGNEIEAHFYFFANCNFNLLRVIMTDLKTLQEKMSKYTHYFCLHKKFVDNYGKDDCWYVNKYATANNNDNLFKKFVEEGTTAFLDKEKFNELVSKKQFSMEPNNWANTFVNSENNQQFKSCKFLNEAPDLLQMDVNLKTSNPPISCNSLPSYTFTTASRFDDKKYDTYFNRVPVITNIKCDSKQTSCFNNKNFDNYCTNAPLLSNANASPINNYCDSIKNLKNPNKSPSEMRPIPAHDKAYQFNCNFDPAKWPCSNNYNGQLCEKFLQNPMVNDNQSALPCHPSKYVVGSFDVKNAKIQYRRPSISTTLPTKLQQKIDNENNFADTNNNEKIIDSPLIYSKDDVCKYTPDGANKKNTIFAKWPCYGNNNGQLNEKPQHSAIITDNRSALPCLPEKYVVGSFDVQNAKIQYSRPSVSSTIPCQQQSIKNENNFADLNNKNAIDCPLICLKDNVCKYTPNSAHNTAAHLSSQDINDNLTCQFNVEKNNENQEILGRNNLTPTSKIDLEKPYKVYFPCIKNGKIQYSKLTTNQPNENVNDLCKQNALKSNYGINNVKANEKYTCHNIENILYISKPPQRKDQSIQCTTSGHDKTMNAPTNSQICSQNIQTDRKEDSEVKILCNDHSIETKSHNINNYGHSANNNKISNSEEICLDSIHFDRSKCDFSKFSIYNRPDVSFTSEINPVYVLNNGNKKEISQLQDIAKTQKSFIIDTPNAKVCNGCVKYSEPSIVSLKNTPLSNNNILSNVFSNNKIPVSKNRVQQIARYNNVNICGGRNLPNYINYDSPDKRHIASTTKSCSPNKIYNQFIPIQAKPTCLNKYVNNILKTKDICLENIFKTANVKRNVNANKKINEPFLLQKIGKSDRLNNYQFGNPNICFSNIEQAKCDINIPCLHPSLETNNAQYLAPVPDSITSNNVFQQIDNNKLSSNNVPTWSGTTMDIPLKNNGIENPKDSLNVDTQNNYGNVCNTKLNVCSTTPNVLHQDTYTVPTCIQNILKDSQTNKMPSSITCNNIFPQFDINKLFTNNAPTLSGDTDIPLKNNVNENLIDSLTVDNQNNYGNICDTKLSVCSTTPNALRQDTETVPTIIQNILKDSQNIKVPNSMTSYNKFQKFNNNKILTNNALTLSGTTRDIPINNNLIENQIESSNVDTKNNYGAIYHTKQSVCSTTPHVIYSDSETIPTIIQSILKDRKDNKMLNPNGLYDISIIKTPTTQLPMANDVNTSNFDNNQQFICKMDIPISNNLNQNTLDGYKDKNRQNKKELQQSYKSYNSPENYNNDQTPIFPIKNVNEPSTTAVPETAHVCSQFPVNEQVNMGLHNTAPTLPQSIETIGWPQKYDSNIYSSQTKSGNIQYTPSYKKSTIHLEDSSKHIFTPEVTAKYDQISQSMPTNEYQKDFSNNFGSQILRQYERKQPCQTNIDSPSLVSGSVQYTPLKMKVFKIHKPTETLDVLPQPYGNEIVNDLTQNNANKNIFATQTESSKTILPVSSQLSNNKQPNMPKYNILCNSLKPTLVSPQLSVKMEPEYYNTIKSTNITPRNIPDTLKPLPTRLPPKNTPVTQINSFKQFDPILSVQRENYNKPQYEIHVSPVRGTGNIQYRPIGVNTIKKINLPEEPIEALLTAMPQIIKEATQLNDVHTMPPAMNKEIRYYYNQNTAAKKPCDASNEFMYFQIPPEQKKINELLKEYNNNLVTSPRNRVWPYRKSNPQKYYLNNHSPITETGNIEYTPQYAKSTLTSTNIPPNMKLNNKREQAKPYLIIQSPSTADGDIKYTSACVEKATSKSLEETPETMSDILQKYYEPLSEPKQNLPSLTQDSTLKVNQKLEHTATKTTNNIFKRPTYDTNHFPSTQWNLNNKYNVNCFPKTDVPNKGNVSSIELTSELFKSKLTASPSINENIQSNLPLFINDPNDNFNKVLVNSLPKQRFINTVTNEPIQEPIDSIITTMPQLPKNQNTHTTPLLAMEPISEPICVVNYQNRDLEETAHLLAQNVENDKVKLFDTYKLLQRNNNDYINYPHNIKMPCYPNKPQNNLPQQYKQCGQQKCYFKVDTPQTYPGKIQRISNKVYTIPNADPTEKPAESLFKLISELERNNQLGTKPTDQKHFYSYKLPQWVTKHNINTNYDFNIVSDPQKVQYSTNVNQILDHLQPSTVDVHASIPNIAKQNVINFSSKVEPSFMSKDLLPNTFVTNTLSDGFTTELLPNISGDNIEILPLTDKQKDVNTPNNNLKSMDSHSEAGFEQNKTNYLNDFVEPITKYYNPSTQKGNITYSKISVSSIPSKDNSQTTKNLPVVNTPPNNIFTNKNELSSLENIPNLGEKSKAIYVPQSNCLLSQYLKIPYHATASNIKPVVRNNVPFNYIPDIKSVVTYHKKPSTINNYIPVETSNISDALANDISLKAKTASKQESNQLASEKTRDTVTNPGQNPSETSLIRTRQKPCAFNNLMKNIFKKNPCSISSMLKEGRKRNSAEPLVKRNVQFSSTPKVALKVPNIPKQICHVGLTPMAHLPCTQRWYKALLESTVPETQPSHADLITMPNLSSKNPCHVKLVAPTNLPHQQSYQSEPSVISTQPYIAPNIDLIPPNLYRTVPPLNPTSTYQQPCQTLTLNLPCPKYEHGMSTTAPRPGWSQQTVPILRQISDYKQPCPLPTSQKKSDIQHFLKPTNILTPSQPCEKASTSTSNLPYQQPSQSSSLLPCEQTDLPMPQLTPHPCFQPMPSVTTKQPSSQPCQSMPCWTPIPPFKSFSTPELIPPVFANPINKQSGQPWTKLTSNTPCQQLFHPTTIPPWEELSDKTPSFTPIQSELPTAQLTPAPCQLTPCWTPISSFRPFKRAPILTYSPCQQSGQPWTKLTLNTPCQIPIQPTPIPPCEQHSHTTFSLTPSTLCQQSELPTPLLTPHLHFQPTPSTTNSQHSTQPWQSTPCWTPIQSFKPFISAHTSANLLYEQSDHPMAHPPRAHKMPSLALSPPCIQVELATPQLTPHPCVQPMPHATPSQICSRPCKSTPCWNSTPSFKPIKSAPTMINPPYQQSSQQMRKLTSNTPCQPLSHPAPIPLWEQQPALLSGFQSVPSATPNPPSSQPCKSTPCWTPITSFDSFKTARATNPPYQQNGEAMHELASNKPCQQPCHPMPCPPWHEHSEITPSLAPFLPCQQTQLPMLQPTPHPDSQATQRTTPSSPRPQPCKSTQYWTPISDFRPFSTPPILTDPPCQQYFTPIPKRTSNKPSQQPRCSTLLLPWEQVSKTTTSHPCSQHELPRRQMTSYAGSQSISSLIPSQPCLQPCLSIPSWIPIQSLKPFSRAPVLINPPCAQSSQPKHKLISNMPCQQDLIPLPTWKQHNTITPLLTPSSPCKPPKLPMTELTPFRGLHAIPCVSPSQLSSLPCLSTPCWTPIPRFDCFKTKPADPRQPSSQPCSIPSFDSFKTEPAFTNLPCQQLDHSTTVQPWTEHSEPTPLVTPNPPGKEPEFPIQHLSFQPMASTAPRQFSSQTYKSTPRWSPIPPFDPFKTTTATPRQPSSQPCPIPSFDFFKTAPALTNTLSQQSGQPMQDQTPITSYQQPSRPMPLPPREQLSKTNPSLMLNLPCEQPVLPITQLIPDPCFQTMPTADKSIPSAIPYQSTPRWITISPIDPLKSAPALTNLPCQQSDHSATLRSWTELGESTSSVTPNPPGTEPEFPLPQLTPHLGFQTVSSTDPRLLSSQPNESTPRWSPIPLFDPFKTATATARQPSSQPCPISSFDPFETAPALANALSQQSGQPMHDLTSNTPCQQSFHPVHLPPQKQLSKTNPSLMLNLPCEQLVLPITQLTPEPRYQSILSAALREPCLQSGQSMPSWIPTLPLDPFKTTPAYTNPPCQQSGHLTTNTPVQQPYHTTSCTPWEQRRETTSLITPILQFKQSELPMLQHTPQLDFQPVPCATPRQPSSQPCQTTPCWTPISSDEYINAALPPQEQLSKANPLLTLNLPCEQSELPITQLTQDSHIQSIPSAGPSQTYSQPCQLTNPPRQQSGHELTTNKAYRQPCHPTLLQQLETTPSLAPILPCKQPELPITQLKPELGFQSMPNAAPRYISSHPWQLTPCRLLVPSFSPSEIAPVGTNPSCQQSSQRMPLPPSKQLCETNASFARNLPCVPLDLPMQDLTSSTGTQYFPSSHLWPLTPCLTQISSLKPFTKAPVLRYSLCQQIDQPISDKTSYTPRQQPCNSTPMPTKSVSSLTLSPPFGEPELPISKLTPHPCSQFIPSVSPSQQISQPCQSTPFWTPSPSFKPFRTAPLVRNLPCQQSGQHKPCQKKIHPSHILSWKQPRNTMPSLSLNEPYRQPLLMPKLTLRPCSQFIPSLTSSQPCHSRAILPWEQHSEISPNSLSQQPELPVLQLTPDLFSQFMPSTTPKQPSLQPLQTPCLIPNLPFEAIRSIPLLFNLPYQQLDQPIQKPCSPTPYPPCDQLSKTTPSITLNVPHRQHELPIQRMTANSEFKASVIQSTPSAQPCSSAPNWSPIPSSEPYKRAPEITNAPNLHPKSLPTEDKICDLTPLLTPSQPREPCQSLPCSTPIPFYKPFKTTSVLTNPPCQQLDQIVSIPCQQPCHPTIVLPCDQVSKITPLKSASPLYGQSKLPMQQITSHPYYKLKASVTRSAPSASEITNAPYPQPCHLTPLSPGSKIGVPTPLLTSSQPCKPFLSTPLLTPVPLFKSFKTAPALRNPLCEQIDLPVHEQPLSKPCRQRCDQIPLSPRNKLSKTSTTTTPCLPCLQTDLPMLQLTSQPYFQSTPSATPIQPSSQPCQSTPCWTPISFFKPFRTAHVQKNPICQQLTQTMHKLTPYKLNNLPCHLAPWQQLSKTTPSLTLRAPHGQSELPMQQTTSHPYSEFKASVPQSAPSAQPFPSTPSWSPVPSFEPFKRAPVLTNPPCQQLHTSIHKQSLKTPCQQPCQPTLLSPRKQLSDTRPLLKPNPCQSSNLPMLKLTKQPCPQYSQPCQTIPCTTPIVFSEPFRTVLVNTPYHQSDQPMHQQTSSTPCHAPCLSTPVQPWEELKEITSSVPPCLSCGQAKSVMPPLIPHPCSQSMPSLASLQPCILSTPGLIPLAPCLQPCSPTPLLTPSKPCKPCPSTPCWTPIPPFNSFPTAHVLTNFPCQQSDQPILKQTSNTPQKPCQSTPLLPWDLFSKITPPVTLCSPCRQDELTMSPLTPHPCSQSMPSSTPSQPCVSCQSRPCETPSSPSKPLRAILGHPPCHESGQPLHKQLSNTPCQNPCHSTPLPPWNQRSEMPSVTPCPPCGQVELAMPQLASLPCLQPLPSVIPSAHTSQPCQSTSYLTLIPSLKPFKKPPEITNPPSQQPFIATPLLTPGQPCEPCRWTTIPTFKSLFRTEPVLANPPCQQPCNPMPILTPGQSCQPCQSTLISTPIPPFKSFTTAPVLTNQPCQQYHQPMQKQISNIPCQSMPCWTPSPSFKSLRTAPVTNRPCPQFSQPIYKQTSNTPCPQPCQSTPLSPLNQLSETMPLVTPCQPYGQAELSKPHLKPHPCSQSPANKTPGKPSLHPCFQSMPCVIPCTPSSQPRQSMPRGNLIPPFKSFKTAPEITKGPCQKPCHSTPPEEEFSGATPLVTPIQPCEPCQSMPCWTPPFKFFTTEPVWINSPCKQPDQPIDKQISIAPCPPPCQSTPLPWEQRCQQIMPPCEHPCKTLDDEYIPTNNGNKNICPIVKLQATNPITNQNLMAINNMPYSNPSIQCNKAEDLNNQYYAPEFTAKSINNQKTVASKEIITPLIDLLISKLKTCSQCLNIEKDLTNKKPVSIPIGLITKSVSDEKCNYFYLKTGDKNIILKGWQNPIKGIKVSLLIEPVLNENCVYNFMPIVNQKCFCSTTVQDFAKTCLKTNYGEAVIVNGHITNYKASAIVCDVNDSVLNNKYYILWPAQFDGTVKDSHIPDDACWRCNTGSNGNYKCTFCTEPVKCTNRCLRR